MGFSSSVSAKDCAFFLVKKCGLVSVVVEMESVVVEMETSFDVPDCGVVKDYVDAPVDYAFWVRDWGVVVGESVVAVSHSVRDVLARQSFCWLVQQIVSVIALISETTCDSVEVARHCCLSSYHFHYCYQNDWSSDGDDL